ncbi:MAG: TIGR02281 family clan AA aspartic protease [Sphingomonadaceae bacterium]|nr:TIGR02281 family clan AA aspartic protease [Sphingomonadaceae bacterium]
MSSGGNIVWLGLGLIGVALLAPHFGAGPSSPPSPPTQTAGPAEGARTVSAATPRAGNGFASREIQRAPDGHFYLDAQVNGARIHFLIDTGASMVALTPADAQRAGIALPSGRAVAQGAGGSVEIIPVTIDRIAAGPLEARGVPGAVARELPISLLGQSFLSRVGNVQISGDRMVLR